MLCDICGKTVHSVQAFQKHQRSHGSHKCSKCASLFKTDLQLQEHERSHDNNEYPCNSCELSFKTALDLVLHRYTHIKSYSCHYCGYTSKGKTRKASMINHIKRHEDKWEFWCNICNRGLMTKRNYEDHMEKHAAVPKYQCEFCGKKFTVKTYLSSHRMINHKKELLGIEENFECEECQKKFTLKKNLLYHLSSIHNIGKSNKVQCPVCEKTVANNYNLKNHMRVHTGSMFKCELCGKGFTRMQKWKEHQNNHLKHIPNRPRP